MIGQRKVAVGFAVQSALPLRDLQTDCSDNLTVGALCNLEFRNALRQVVGRQMHGLPERSHLGQVIQ